MPTLEPILYKGMLCYDSYSEKALEDIYAGTPTNYLFYKHLIWMFLGRNELWLEKHGV